MSDDEFELFLAALDDLCKVLYDFIEFYSVSDDSRLFWLVLGSL